MKVYQLQFDDLVIQVTRKAIRHMYVRIKSPDGQVCVSIPQRASRDFIQQQLEGKLEWIRSQRQLQIAKARELTPAAAWNDNIAFLGKTHTLIMQPADRSNPVRIEGDNIVFSIAENTSEQDKLRVMDHWYRQQFQTLLPALITKWEPIIGKRVASFTIRSMKTRWGSCNTRTGRICLNLNLIKKPLTCLEYVLVHEMVHLHEASHNRRFYKLMNQFMPGWQMQHAILEPRSRLARSNET